MPQYAVMIFERVPADELPPEVMAGHRDLPRRVAEAGGRIAAGVGLELTENAAEREFLVDRLN